MNKTVIIVAGGSGLRMGADLPKQFLLLRGIPVIMHTIECFYQYDPHMKCLLVLPKDHLTTWKSLCQEYFFTLPHQIVEGGKERFFSVKNALNHCGETEMIFIHDGVRPLVSQETISACAELCAEKGNAIPVVNSIESIRLSDGDKNMAIDRSKVKLVQTPQVFQAKDILEAYNQDYRSDFTDDASVLEKAGFSIFLSEGNRENIKITNPADIELAELYLNEFETNLK